MNDLIVLLVLDLQYKTMFKTKNKQKINKKT